MTGLLEIVHHKCMLPDVISCPFACRAYFGHILLYVQMVSSRFTDAAAEVLLIYTCIHASTNKCKRTHAQQHAGLT